MSGSNTAKQIRLDDLVARVRPCASAVGLLVLATAFGLAAYAILRDHELRVHHLWNGVAGTRAGTAVHQENVALADQATTIVVWVTALLGLLLIVPRRVEPLPFRLLGWISLVVAALLCALAASGATGVGLRGLLASLDPRCPLDGDCKQIAPRAMSPQDWLISYGGQLAVAASFSAAMLSACSGVRWLIWAGRALLRRIVPQAESASLSPLGRSDFPQSPLASFGLYERFRLFALFALVGHGVGAREPGFWSTAPQPFFSTESVGSPRFRGDPCQRALLSDPGGPTIASPCRLGRCCLPTLRTSSAPRWTLSRLNGTARGAPIARTGQGAGDLPRPAQEAATQRAPVMTQAQLQGALGCAVRALSISR